MTLLYRRLVLAAALMLALGLDAVAPGVMHTARLLAAQDDSVVLAGVALDRALDAPTVERGISDALKAGDVDLAQSFLQLADERGVRVVESTRNEVAAAAVREGSPLNVASRFAEGFFTGEPDDLATLAGTVTGDLFVFGDIRDVLRESARAARGEEVDELILGLACVGLAVTAGTYATLGASAPARIGISMFKAASRSGRMTARLGAAMLRPLHGVVDRAALFNALGPRAVLQPAVAVRAAREAVKVERMHGLLDLFGAAGRIQAKAGTRAALDGLRIAESPQDMAKLAQLAAANGGKTRAVLKVLGRGAIALTVGLWEVASWFFSVLLMLLGICSSLKHLTERAALRFFRWQRRSRARLATA